MDDNQERKDFSSTESDSQLSADEETLLDQLGITGAARRKFLGQSMAALLGTFAFHLLAKEEALATLAAAPDAVFAQTPGVENAVNVLLKINGSAQRLEVDSRTALLDALRERLGLTGTKKGCDQGQCGACTVILDGRRVNSCLALAVAHQDAEIVTIEGIANGDNLHPLQQAFIKHDAFQCGYCTPGQLCSAIGMLREAEAGWPSAVTTDLTAESVTLSDEEIRERMSGNLCRCGAYANIV